jgi:hypothetical protein
MPKLRVHNISISRDGYAAGPDQSLHNPLGVGGERLHEWAVAARSFGTIHGTDSGGSASCECVEFVSSPAVAHARLARSEPR